MATYRSSFSSLRGTIPPTSAAVLDDVIDALTTELELEKQKAEASREASLGSSRATVWRSRCDLPSVTCEVSSDARLLKATLPRWVLLTIMPKNLPVATCLRRNH